MFIGEKNLVGPSLYGGPPQPVGLWQIAARSSRLFVERVPLVCFYALNWKQKLRPQNHDQDLYQEITITMITLRSETSPTKPGRKYEKVRDGAAVIFLRDGYAGASVDEITRAAGVSKATLYSYFPEKSVMFREAILAEVCDAFRESPFDKPRDGHAADILPNVLTNLADWAAAKQRLRLLRVITAEGVRFPTVAAAYEKSLYIRIINPLAKMIETWIDRGQIDVHDSDRSARQLVAMVTGQVQQHAMLAGTEFTKEQLSTFAQGAARLFLSSHAVASKQHLQTLTPQKVRSGGEAPRAQRLGG